MVASFSTSTIAFRLALAAAASSLLVAAQVNPVTPSPGDVYKTGQDCLVKWKGDPSGSKTDWKKMAIQLMTGDNFNMVHLTTVAHDQDGTVDGEFKYPCPGVDPNAPIYFYQFTAPAVPKEKTQWTTRFAIAKEDGSTVPAPNPTQPDDKHSPIPWGTGKLLDPSKAVPPPDFTSGTVTTAKAGATDTSGEAPPSGPVNGTETTTTTTTSSAGAGPTPKGHKCRCDKRHLHEDTETLKRRMIVKRSEPPSSDAADADTTPPKPSPSSAALGRIDNQKDYIHLAAMVLASFVVGLATVL